MVTHYLARVKFRAISCKFKPTGRIVAPVGGWGGAITPLILIRAEDYEPPRRLGLA